MKFNNLSVIDFKIKSILHYRYNDIYYNKIRSSLKNFLMFYPGGKKPNLSR